MFNIPGWLSNALLIFTCFISFYQHVQLKRPNPITNLQFVTIVFALVMILLNTFRSQNNTWLSLVFFLVALACLTTMIRQFRMLPPKKRFESL